MVSNTVVNVGSVAKTVAIDPIYRNLQNQSIRYVPQHIAVFAQGASASSYTTSPTKYTGAKQVGEAYGYGSPIHLIAKQLFPVTGDGVGNLPVTFFPLEDHASGVVASGDIAPSGAVTKTGTFEVFVNNEASERFTVQAGDSVATIVTAITTAINANPSLPVIASDDTTEVGLTSKWKGVSANAVYIEVKGTEATGVSFAVTQLTGGATNPDLSASLALASEDTWYTVAINALDGDDTNALDDLESFGVTRWGAQVRKPLIAFHGRTDSTVSAATAISDSRKNDYINSQLIVPGSRDLPFVIAARIAGLITLRANNNPAQDAARIKATGLTPSVTWTYSERDAAVKAGSSTIYIKDNTVEIADVVTFYHPTGEEPPALRFVVQIFKIMQILYNLDIKFNNSDWDGAPLIPDGQPTANRAAKRPSMAKAVVSDLIDVLALEAVISDPETAKANTQVGIDPQNPNRLNINMTVQLSGNINIISIEANYGFYFGERTVI